MALERTAKELGVDLLYIGLERIDSKRWMCPGCRATSVEQAVLQCFEPDGWVGYWREGGLLLNLIKAMSFPVIPPRQKHRFIESIYAQNGVAEDLFDKDWLLDNVRNATRDKISHNAHLMLTKRRGESAFTDQFPDLEHWMFLGLFDALGSDTIYAIASRFAEDPYEYAKGWPDVTMWKKNLVRFLEVKAPGDSLQKSQWTIVRKFIKPLSLEFELTAVQPLKAESKHNNRQQAELRRVEVVRDTPQIVRPPSDRNPPILWTISESSYWNIAENVESPCELTWGEVEDAIRKRPNEGLAKALSWPPWAAWQTAMKAIRKLVREKRNLKEDDSAELFLLYASAALDSLKPSFSKKCQCQGLEIANTIPRGVLADLKITYDNLGYEKLRLLSLTDIRWIVEAWGEPSAHSTLNEMEKRVWEKWEEKYWVLQNTYVGCPQCGFPIKKHFERYGDLSRWCVTCAVVSPDKLSMEPNWRDSANPSPRVSRSPKGCAIAMLAVCGVVATLWRSLS